MGEEFSRRWEMLPRTGEACRKMWFDQLRSDRPLTRNENSHIIIADCEHLEYWVTMTSGLSFCIQKEQLVENHFNSNLRQQYEIEVGSVSHAREELLQMNFESSSGVGSSNGEENVPGDDNNVSKEVVDEINTWVKSDNALEILSTSSNATETFIIVANIFLPTTSKFQHHWNFQIPFADAFLRVFHSQPPFHTAAGG